MRPSWKERCATAAEPIVVFTPGEVIAESSIQNDVAAMISGTDTTARPPCAQATLGQTLLHDHLARRQPSIYDADDDNPCACIIVGHFCCDPNSKAKEYLLQQQSTDCLNPSKTFLISPRIFKHSSRILDPKSAYPTELYWVCFPMLQFLWDWKLVKQVKKLRVIMGIK